MSSSASNHRTHTTMMVRCKGFGRNPAKNRMATCGPGLSIAEGTPMLEALDQASAAGWEVITSYTLGDAHVTFVLSKRSGES